MFWATLADLCAAVDSRIEPAFIDRGSLDAIRSIAEHVPAKAVDSFAFERRLGGDDPQIDFAFALSARGSAWLSDGELWPEIRDALTRAVRLVRPHGLWLEFDRRQMPDLAETPSAYVGLRVHPDNFAERIALSECLNDTPGTSWEIVDRCIRAFPVSVGRMYVGAMRSRRTGGIRLTVNAFDFAGLIRYLHDVRWPGDVGDVAAQLRPYASLCRRFCVQLDVAAAMSPWLGVELMPVAVAPDRRGDENSRAMLQLVADSGLCSAFEHAQLAAWPSQTAYAAPLIDRLIEAASPHPNERLCDGVLVTAINDVKFVFGASPTVVCKVYLSAFVAPAA